MSSGDNVESLSAKVHQLEAELAQKNKVIQDLNRRVQESNEGAQSTTEISEIEETLRRLMTRIGMIVQGTKCLLMVVDSETGDLVAEKPT
ncbi:MAG: hypothetical protein ACKO5K_06815, partial [Armatimonadota bacterium]